MRKKLSLAVMLCGMILITAGCANFNKPITAESEGIWDEWFVYPLSWLIKEVAAVFGGNYGISIIIVTIMIRLVLLPLMIKQTKSSKAMQDIQPEIKKLREKYSSKDQQTQRKMQEETMKLFQKHNVNPMAGCLPILVQMPILIAFYHAINRTKVIENHTFLWFSLGEPDFILPIIAAALTFVQQKLMLGKAENVNPQMAMMTYIMPVMILAIGFFLPSALALYWVVGNLFMIGQIFIIYKPSDLGLSKSTGGSKK